MSEPVNSPPNRWRTPAEIRTRIDAELETARHSDDPWPALERAHLLSQPWAWPHTRVHGAMLAVGFARRDRREVIGQLVRLIVAGPGSLTGRYPAGNTGRTTMALTETADLPDDISDTLRRHTPQ
jgi:hypothetical protein